MVDGYINDAEIYLAVFKNTSGDPSLGEVRHTLEELFVRERQQPPRKTWYVGFDPPISGSLDGLNDVDRLVGEAVPRIVKPLRDFSEYQRWSPSVSVFPVVLDDRLLAGRTGSERQRLELLAGRLESEFTKRLIEQAGREFVVVDGRQRLRDRGIPVSTLNYLDRYSSLICVHDAHVHAGVLVTLVPGSGNDAPEGSPARYAPVVRLQFHRGFQIDVIEPDRWPQSEAPSHSPTPPDPASQIPEKIKTSSKICAARARITPRDRVLFAFRLRPEERKTQ
jgi:hypothetical protein